MFLRSHKCFLCGYIKEITLLYCAYINAHGINHSWSVIVTLTGLIPARPLFNWQTKLHRVKLRSNHRTFGTLCVCACMLLLYRHNEPLPLNQRSKWQEINPDYSFSIHERSPAQKRQGSGNKGGKGIYLTRSDSFKF